MRCINGVGFFLRIQIVSYSDSASDPCLSSPPSPSPSLPASSLSGATVRANDGVPRAPDLDPVFSGLNELLVLPAGTFDLFFSLDASPAGTAFISEPGDAGDGVPDVSPAAGVVAVASVDDMSGVYT